MQPDIIVVGGGSAGCVVAARLSEDPGRQVLLLEAGPPSGGIASRIPAAFNKLFKGPTDWGYETAPDPRFDGRRHYWPRGRMLGGSSAMNAMVWTPGDAADFDGWAALGCDGWAWNDVAPWFDRIGIVPELLPRYNPIATAFVEAAEGAGLARNDGFRGGRMAGAGLLYTSTHRGERNSAERAYLRPARSRSNLMLRTGANVERVVFERGRAAGVEVRTGGGATETIRARKAIVLSAGAIGSPVLLLRSGIGAPEELARNRIPLVARSEHVGENMSDHLAAGLAYRCRMPVTLEGARGPGSLIRWLLFKDGPLVSNVAEAAAFLRIDPSSPAPDMEILCGVAWFVDHGFREFDGHGFVLAAIGLRPESRGRLRLGADASDRPVIDAGYLSHPADLPVMRAGLRRAAAIAEALPLAPYRGDRTLPAAEQLDDDVLGAHLRAVGQTLYHPAGTCRMGSDPESVVDPMLRVRGVEGLWIADASVMPRLVSAHPNAAVLMIGERGADNIQRIHS
jgi:choline dehydrogenase